MFQFFHINSIIHNLNHYKIPQGNLVWHAYYLLKCSTLCNYYISNTILYFKTNGNNLITNINNLVYLL